MHVLGISAYYHDSAAALVVDGRVVAAIQEERFTRVKHDAAFPAQAMQSCLAIGGIEPHDIDYIVFYEKPLVKFERLLETYLAFAPRGFRSFSNSFPIWVKEKLYLKSMLNRDIAHALPGKELRSELLFSEHHLSHAASAFYPSPFESAAVLTMDGVGEWSTTSVGVGQGRNIELANELHFPHSLGLLYSAFTYYAGFKVNSGEYKLMGLAPFGAPRFAQRIHDELVDLKPDGSFRLNQKYFDYCTGARMTNDHFSDLFGAPGRRPGEPITQHHMDIAASIQSVTENIVLRLAKFTRKETGQQRLCLAGGVALNCVANGKLRRENVFDDLWVQPASGDAGGALGAALAAYHSFHDGERICNESDSMSGSFLGPEFRQADIEARLRCEGARFDVLTQGDLLSETSQLLAQGRVIGWFQGRMEFGPRALGNRSILADPRPHTMQSELNQRIKFREGFRPFAPSVLSSECREWFDLDGESPYMLFVDNVASKHFDRPKEGSIEAVGFDRLHEIDSDIPAVTHVDGSSRIQTVSRDRNSLFHDLISAFQNLTGCPILVNTSFNVRGEPIVATPEDAFRCFMGTNLDALAIGNCLLHKSRQQSSLNKNYQNKFDLD